jgi:Fur family transcriptional regulator, zinc uptake regulator
MSSHHICAPAPFTPHDHDHCMSDAIARATALCKQRQVRLTPQRQQVLELIWASHKPVGAYELMERMRGKGGQVAPPTVYRALDFLCEQGLVHRIESLNAFIGCNHPEDDHRAQFLVCVGCGQIAEVSDSAITTAINHAAAAQGFLPQRRTVEISGLCRHCQCASSATTPDRG